MRLTAFALVITLAVPTASLAQGGPIANAATAAITQNNGQSSSGKVGMFWAGIALMGAGATLSILANTALRKEDCFFSSTFFVCEEYTPKGIWAAGVGMAAAGGILTTIGASRSVVVGPNRIAYRWRF